MQSNRTTVQTYFESLQDTICRALQSLDGTGAFREDLWNHEAGGGGRTRVLEGGAVFEKGGVNTSAVSGVMNAALAKRMDVPPQEFFATGISLVLHPLSPMIPTVHANFRYFELADGSHWFGGGADLTPYYLFEEDCRHFHRTWKNACDSSDATLYPAFKQSCDEYFYLRHRKEARGIGGIFFDYLRGAFEHNFALVCACGDAFLPSYVPIVEQRRSMSWNEQERRWQLLRRGRYVEFNLVYDRGTVFGLETEGRTESILMSLPPLVRWDYDIQPIKGSREEELLQVLRQPTSWV